MSKSKLRSNIEEFQEYCENSNLEKIKEFLKNKKYFRNYNPEFTEFDKDEEILPFIEYVSKLAKSNPVPFDLLEIIIKDTDFTKYLIQRENLYDEERNKKTRNEIIAEITPNFPSQKNIIDKLKNILPELNHAELLNESGHCMALSLTYGHYLIKSGERGELYPLKFFKIINNLDKLGKFNISKTEEEITKILSNNTPKVSLQELLDFSFSPQNLTQDQIKALSSLKVKHEDQLELLGFIDNFIKIQKDHAQEVEDSLKKKNPDDNKKRFGEEISGLADLKQDLLLIFGFNKDLVSKPNFNPFINKELLKEGEVYLVKMPYKNSAHAITVEIDPDFYKIYDPNFDSIICLDRKINIVEYYQKTLAERALGIYKLSKLNQQVDKSAFEESAKWMKDYCSRVDLTKDSADELAKYAIIHSNHEILEILLDQGYSGAKAWAIANVCNSNDTTKDICKKWFKKESCNKAFLKVFLINEIEYSCINFKTEEGQSPLHIAAKNRSIHFLNRLIHQGANLNIADNDGKTALDIAIDEKVLLDKALKEKNSEIIIVKDFDWIKKDLDFSLEKGNLKLIGHSREERNKDDLMIIQILTDEGRKLIDDSKHLIKTETLTSNGKTEPDIAIKNKYLETIGILTKAFFEKAPNKFKEKLNAAILINDLDQIKAIYFNIPKELKKERSEILLNILEVCNSNSKFDLLDRFIQKIDDEEKLDLFRKAATKKYDRAAGIILNSSKFNEDQQQSYVKHAFLYNKDDKDIVPTIIACLENDYCDINIKKEGNLLKINELVKKNKSYENFYSEVQKESLSEDYKNNAPIKEYAQLYFVTKAIIGNIKDSQILSKSGKKKLEQLHRAIYYGLKYNENLKEDIQSIFLEKDNEVKNPANLKDNANIKSITDSIIEEFTKPELKISKESNSKLPSFSRRSLMSFDITEDSLLNIKEALQNIENKKNPGKSPGSAQVGTSSSFQRG